jgi:hypothetical protein
MPGATRFPEKVGLKRGPLSLVSKIEGLLKRKSSGSGLENRNNGLSAKVGRQAAVAR